MRVLIKASPKFANTIISFNYNQYLQAFIYSLFKKDAPGLHSKGYNYQKRTFRLFTFSRIFSDQMEKVQSGFLVKEDIYFYISFYVERDSQIALINFLSLKTLRIGNSEFRITSIKTLNDDLPIKNEDVSFAFLTLSPIVARRTFNKTGTAKTKYYSPNDSQFYDLVSENLKKKAHCVNIGKEAQQFSITPVDYDIKRSRAPVQYKNFFIVGYTGIFNFTGDRNMAKIAYHAGVGEKNSQGFGMIKILI